MIVKLHWDEGGYPIFFECEHNDAFPFETTIEEWNEFTKAANIFWAMQNKMKQFGEKGESNA